MSTAGQGKGIGVEVTDLKAYAKDLDYYQEEATKFQGLVERADVSEESWGLIGLAVKGQYTTKLDELNELLQLMSDGVGTFSNKIIEAAKIYEGLERDAIVSFGKHEAELDGPLD